jgi:hypothetical protein
VKAREVADDGYTREELLVLASLRRTTGRTCRNCVWFVTRGKHRGCFPAGRYRKWLSLEEFDSGCDMFSKMETKK